MAQGRRPDPFRTRKLRPGTAMVLHPEGCGRVARRRTQTSKGRGHHTCPLPFHIPRTQPPSHPPIPAYPHNDALPAHRASRAPASGIRRMSRHTHLKKLPGPHGKPGCTPAAGKDTGNTPDATTRLRPQHPQESSANPRFPYATEAHQTNQPHLTIHQRNQFGRRQDCLQCVETTRRPWPYRPVNQKSTASGSLHAPPIPRSPSITCMSSSVNSKSNTFIFDRIRFICTDFGSGNTSCCNAQRTQT